MKDYDEMALKIIREWEAGIYLNGCQVTAALQSLIAKALREVAGE